MQRHRDHVRKELEGELPAPGGVWEAQSRWPWPLAVLVPGSHANQPGSRVEGRRRARRAGSRETRRLGGHEAGSKQGAPKRAPVRNQRSCAVYQTGVQSIMRSGSERLSSGGAAVNSVRLSLLLACTAVCAAPGLLPVAGFPHSVPVCPRSSGLLVLVAQAGAGIASPVT